DQGKFAFNMAMAISKAFNPTYNPLFVYSESGLGKTHLMYAIANYIEQKNRDRNYLYFSMIDFEDEFSKFLFRNRTIEFREFLKKADLIIIDDIQLCDNKGDLQDEIFNICNFFIHNRKQLVITSDVSPLQLSWLDERLQSRLMGGVIINIQPYSTETKIEILKNDARLNRIELPQEVYEYIGSNSDSNIRKLKGVMKMIMAKHKMESKTIDIEDVKPIMDQIFPQKKKGK
ncbi:ATP-binding protein, partial [bacterium]|nr:ATP-binding protein [bacterium]